MGLTQRRFSPLLELLEDRQLLAGNIISGYVFSDLNGNGLREAGETAIANNPIELRNAAGVVIGSTTTDSNGFYSFDGDSSVSGGVQSQTQTLTFADANANTIRSQALQQFDPSLGTLQSIEIRVDGRIVSNIKLENLDDEAAAVSGSVSGTVLLSGPGFNLNTNIVGNAVITQTLGAYDGVTDYTGRSGVSLGNRTATGSNTQTLTGTSVAPFIGTGTLNLSFLAQATTQAAGGGNLQANITNLGGGSVTVTYKYLNSTSLRPGNYTLVQKTQPAGLLDGRESQNGIIVANSINTDTLSVTLGASDSVNNNFGEYAPASLNGYVYQDANKNGVREATEKVFANSKITLTGTNDKGQAINLQSVTNASGYYEFTDLRPGQYAIKQTLAPTGVTAGKLTAGSLGGTIGSARDFQAIQLLVGATGNNYNFAHIGPQAPSSGVTSASKTSTAVSTTPRPPSPLPVTPPAPIRPTSASKTSTAIGRTPRPPSPITPVVPAPIRPTSASKTSTAVGTTPRPPSSNTPPAPIPPTSASKTSTAARR